MASSSAGHGNWRSTVNSDPDSSSSSSSSPSLNSTPGGAATSAVDSPLLRSPNRQAAARDHAASIEGVSQVVAISPQSSNSNPSQVSAQQQQQQQPRAETRVPSSSSSSSLLPLRSVVGYHHRNAFSSDSIPRQTIMKAIVSRPFLSSDNNPSGTVPRAACLRSFQNAYPSPPEDSEEQQSISVSSQGLASELNRLPDSAYLDRLDRSLVLQSPCFFHQRFDDAVNIKKVLEEITDDEWLSHSRLVQTATGVREVSKQLQRRPIRRAVRNVMIVTKARDNSLVHLTHEVAAWLMSTPRYGSDRGVNVYVDAQLKKSKRFDAAGLVQSEPHFQRMLHYWTPDMCWTAPEKFDLVITLGGDGTVLFTSWLFQRVVPPVLCFSLGSLGFLTNFDFGNYKSLLNGVMGDVGMRVNLRMRFTCTVFRTDRSKGGAAPGEVEEGEQFEVLNELVIDRGPSPYVSNLELYADNELLTVVQADGCIFSTPTGSTAYSLSAGGSLIHPSIPGILLTPICPHTLSFRPMVLSDSSLLRIAVPVTSRSTAYCSFDGKGRVELRQGDYVTIEASQYPFPTVVSGNGEWFHSVRRALRWNTRGSMQKPWGDDSGSGNEDEEWDIDTDGGLGGTDSGVGQSEDGDAPTSPMRRQMNFLPM